MECYFKSSHIQTPRSGPLRTRSGKFVTKICVNLQYNIFTSVHAIVVVHKSNNYFMNHIHKAWLYYLISVVLASFVTKTVIPGLVAKVIEPQEPVNKLIHMASTCKIVHVNAIRGVCLPCHAELIQCKVTSLPL